MLQLSIGPQKFEKLRISTMEKGVRGEALDCAISKWTATTTKTFRFHSLYEDAVEKLPKNHGTLYMEPYMSEAKYEMKFSVIRLVTPCVSRPREARYAYNVRLNSLYEGL
jgi:hypothetical protein